jgi:hypothetical protein
MAGPYDGLITGSGMVPGQIGWVVLDVNGVPQTLQPTMPAAGTLFCPALLSTQSAPFDALVTLTGAPLTSHMQPDNNALA